MAAAICFFSRSLKFSEDLLISKGVAAIYILILTLTYQAFAPSFKIVSLSLWMKLSGVNMYK